MIPPANPASFDAPSARTLPLASVRAPAFDLAATLGCGQVFHWVREGEGWLGVIASEAVYLEQHGDELLVSAGCERLVSHYFALDHPLEEICASFPTDPAMMEAARFCAGMRLVRQPIWECLATFITSSMKQVAHIAQMSHAIRTTFGEPVDWNGKRLFAYPGPDRLALATEEELRACGLGFRAKNLLGTARMIMEGKVDLAVVSRLDDDAARAELCRLPGVGVKVANCVLLFGYERLRAFPIDVWIERILRELYFARKRNVTVERLREFCGSYFGPFGGYAQQYLFHHGRKTWKKPKTKPRR
ncbi:MAG: 8-oxoguanine glycosylase domain protein [Chthoniobacteraceae bacterium]|nr:8-oxoguanine glycosylase domain protein [Chthoniobacteraceae bacterium]